MNGRFEKLLAESFFDQAADQADTKVYKLNDAMMQKFAEAIVRECARVGFNAAYPGKGVIVKMAIKEHFGVEK